MRVELADKSHGVVYVFQADGRIFEFSLDSDDGTLEGATKDIWNVCEIDGLTGNVVAVSKSRRILAVKISIFFGEVCYNICSQPNICS